jgi:hypothetical protein
MTEPKREPFAYVEKFKDTENYFVVAGGHTILPTQRKNDADYRAFMLNAAFNARVDEEVRKAVEDFRERAAKLMEDPDACPEDIRRLPTEPEGK